MTLASAALNVVLPIMQVAFGPLLIATLIGVIGGPLISRLPIHARARQIFLDVTYWARWVTAGLMLVTIALAILTTVEAASTMALP